MEVFLRDLEPNASYAVQVRAVNRDGASPWSGLFVFESGLDLVAPKPVSNLQWKTEGNSFVATWAVPIQNADGTNLEDLKDFVVVISSGGSLATRTFYTTTPTFTLSFVDNSSIFGFARPSITVDVRCRDTTGNMSTPVTATATNPPPAAPATLRTISQIESIYLDWDAVTESDLAYYEVYLSNTDPNFVPDSTTNRIYSGVANTFTHSTNLYNTDHFYKVRAFDIFRSPSAPTTNVGNVAVRPRTTLTVDAIAPDAPTGLARSAFAVIGNTITTAVSWTAVADPANDLAGYRVRYSPYNPANLSERQWQHVEVGSTETTTILRNLLPRRRYYFEVQSFDFTANESAWISILTTEETPDEKVVEPMIVEGGVIKSANYASGATGWQLSDSGLDVSQGRVAASALLIQNSPNIIEPGFAGFEHHPNFYSNITIGSTFAISTTDVRFQSQALRWTGTSASAAKELYLSNGQTPNIQV